jgi:hypothetical protein
MEDANFTIRSQNGSDEYGIFQSILYLIGETHKRKMILTTATLLTAAQCIVDDADPDTEGQLINDVTASLTLYKQKLKSTTFKAFENPLNAETS